MEEKRVKEESKGEREREREGGRGREGRLRRDENGKISPKE